MAEHVPTPELIGVAVLAAASVTWAVVLWRLLRRPGPRATGRRPAEPLPALPRQRQAGPALESVELTPAEQDAFAGLMRQLADS
ncbi:hypothetical protein [Streptomyces sp. NPDC096012]|uniref:hypothetical protein n=1 Tax=Streptomyces sp. NPDC096012 TaxID=3155684 RepID=UPI00336AA9F8